MEDKAPKPFQRTKASDKILKLTKRIRAVSGGTWASKTISILGWLIDYGQSTQGQDITVVAESVPHLDLGVIKDFKNIMLSNGYWDENSWNASSRSYTFNKGSIIKFVSFDKFGKAHGPRRDILFINEANNIPWDIADQLITRTRKVIWLDWNPSEEFWFYTEMLPNRKKDIDFITLTYKDNDALGEEERSEIESHKNNERWWKVYGLGQLGEAEGRVFTDWQLIGEIPHEARLERYGLDFGYHPDPAAIVSVYYYNGGYILDEVAYSTLLSNQDIAGIFKNLPPALVVADSAEPKSIDEIRRNGVNIVGAEKGSESVRYGVKTIQNQRISVTSKSLNLIREYRNYFQAVDRRSNVPIMGEYEGEDHALDAARYAICSLIPIIQRKEKLMAMPKTYDNRPRINPAV